MQLSPSVPTGLRDAKSGPQIGVTTLTLFFLDPTNSLTMSLDNPCRVPLHCCVRHRNAGFISSFSWSAQLTLIAY